MGENWLGRAAVRHGRRLRVSAVVSHFPGQSETFIERKAFALHSRGLQISILAHQITKDARWPYPVGTFSGSRRRAWLRHPMRSVGLVFVARRRFGAGRQAMRACQRAWTLAGAEADVVHFEFSGLGVDFIDALEILPSIPVMVSCRGAAEQIKPLVEPARAGELRRLFARASVVHCVSSDMARLAIGMGAVEERVLINRPAIDLGYHQRRTPARPNEDPLIVMVGRLHWKKGHDVALLAVRQLLDEGLSPRVEIIGEGAEREKLTYMLHALGLQDVVQLRGSLSPDEVKAALESAALMVLPSLSEGISNAVLEAMAMEVPVVAADVGGMSEVIEHGVHGFLVRPLDAEALARTIREALDHPDLASIGKRARARVEEEFSLERQAQIFDAAYHGLAGPPVGPPPTNTRGG